MRAYFNPLRGQIGERLRFNRMTLADYRKDRERRGLPPLTPEESLMLQVERIEALTTRRPARH